MDQKEFLKRLSELVEWEIPTVGPNGQTSTRRSKVKAISSEDYDWADDADIEFELEPDGPNATLGPRIIRIKNQMRACEDCDKIIDGRVVTKRRLDYPVMHWREKCSCGLHRDPNTGQFTLKDNVPIQTAWKKYLNLDNPDK